jgi:hypothetical protein
MNREYVIMFETDVNNLIETESYNNLEFYTDTNGSVITKRVKNHRFLWNYQQGDVKTDNIYPVNSMLSIRDNKNQNKIFSVWNDRSQGAESIFEGKIFFLINNTSGRDDGRGLAQGLFEQRWNENNPYHFTHFITFGSNFSTKKMNNLINEQPFIIKSIDIKSFNDNILKIEKMNVMNDLILTDDVSNECLDVNYYVWDSEKFLIQVSNNNSDYYFTAPKRDCYFYLNSNKLKENNYGLEEVELNGIKRVNLSIDDISHISNKFNSIKEYSLNYNLVKVSPYEIKTYLVKHLG